MVFWSIRKCWSKLICVLSLWIIFLCGVIVLNRSPFPSRMRHVQLFDNKSVNFSKRLERKQDHLLQERRLVRRYSNKPVSHMTYIRFPYIINKPLSCQNVTLPLYLFVVHTAIENYRKRMDIRNTWGQKLQFKSKYFVLIFVMGRPNNTFLQFAIEKEDELYNDIIQGDFLDVYRNLTHKAVFWLRWVTEFCPNVNHVIKVDDDVFVNTFRVLDVLNGTRDTDRKIYCQLRPAYSNVIPRAGKWKLEKEFFKNFTRYPFPFSNGFIVIYSGKLIPELSKAAEFTPFLWLDDVYVTGILAENVGRVTHVNLGKFVTFHESRTCFRNITKLCNLIAAGASTRITQQYMWSYVLKRYRKNAETLMEKENFDIIFKNT